MADYFPTTEDAQIGFLTRFKSNLSSKATALSLTAAQVLEFATLCDSLVSAIQASQAADAAAKAATATKKLSKRNDLPALRKKIAHIKTAPGMTDAIAAVLEIVGSESSVDLETQVPTFTATAKTGMVVLKWEKGPFDGVNIYTRLRGQSNWLFLDRDNVSPYEDITPLATANTPETREYLLRGVVGDREVGQPSGILSVLFGG